MTQEILRTPIPCGESVVTILRNDEGEIVRQDVEIHVSAEALQTQLGQVR